MNTRTLSRAIFSLGALCLIVWSCAKLQDTLPVAPSVGVHPKGWADTTSPLFHATNLAAHGMHIDSCAACHGADLHGGAARSCAGSGCHNTSKFLFHTDSWVDTSSAQFHGMHIRNTGFTLAVLDSCASCHGSDFAGGPAKTSCSGAGCHVAADNGPAACYTCHGNKVSKTYYPPRALNGSTLETYVGVGQHRGHLADTTVSSHVYGKCITCHVVPDSFRAASHINGTEATVTIGDSIAFKRTNVVGGYKYTDTLPTVIPAPRWDAATQTCSNIYCHGSFKNGNISNAPKWTGVEQVACGTCHGDPATKNPLPGGSHPKKSDCSTCHDAVIDDQNNIIDRSLHINGKLEVLGLVKDVW